MSKEGKRKVVLAAVLLCAAALGALAIREWALGTRHKEEPLDGEEQKVLPVTIGGGDASWESCMNEVAAGYMEEHPDVRVEIRTTSNVEIIDYNKGLLIESAKGELDGIVEMRNTAMYQKEGKLAPLPEELAEKMKLVTRIDGEAYSIPRYYSCYGIIYNREIFDRLGLEEPETYEEFLGICAALKEAGVIPLAMGAGDLWHIDNWVKILFSKDVLSEEPDWITRCNEGKVHWTDEAPVQMLSDFKQLFDLGYVHPQYDVTTDAQTMVQLTAGETAMVCSGTWMFSQLERISPDFKLGWFFVPGESKESAVKLDRGWEWAVTESCRENGMYDEAVEFLEYYYREDVYQEVLRNMNGISALKEMESDVSTPVWRQISEEVKRYGDVQEASLGTGDTPEGFAMELYIQFVAMADGEQGVKETAEALDEEWEKALEGRE